MSHRALADEHCEGLQVSARAQAHPQMRTRSVSTGHLQRHHEQHSGTHAGTAADGQPRRLFPPSPSSQSQNGALPPSSSGVCTCCIPGGKSQIHCKHPHLRPDPGATPSVRACSESRPDCSPVSQASTAFCEPSLMGQSISYCQAGVTNARVLLWWLKHARGCECNGLVVQAWQGRPHVCCQPTSRPS